MAVKQAVDQFTRPDNTTNYADGDLVANHGTAASVVPLKWVMNGDGVQVVAIRVEKADGSKITGADFSLRLFTESPTSAVGDNAALTHSLSGHLVTVDLGVMVAATDDASITIKKGETGFVDGIYVPSNILFGLLEANDAYEPAAEDVIKVFLIYKTDAAA